MTDPPVQVQIPGKAVSDANSVAPPVRSLLEDLHLLGSKTDATAAASFGAAFGGPPQSVALIEAGATAAAKWWATGIGVTATATWVSLVGWWGGQESSIKLTALAGVAFVVAAAILSIGYLIASDVRGRAAAAVATIEARARIGTTMIEAAEAVYEPPSAPSAVQLVPLPQRFEVKVIDEPANNEDGWRAVAIERQADGTIEYIVVKGKAQSKKPASKLEFK
jgi:hypothetical protein